MVKSDIEIARAASVRPIGEIAAKLDIPTEAISLFGHTKAKVSLAIPLRTILKLIN